MTNNNSPIIQNPPGVPNNGTSPISSYSGEITEQQAANMANFTQPQFSGYGLISSPIQYGSLGYNPGIQSFNPQVTYNRGAVPQYNSQYSGYNYSYQDQTYTIPGFNPSNTNVMYSSDLEEKRNELNRQMNEEIEKYNENNIYSNYNYYGNLNRVNPFIVEKYRKKQYELELEAKQKRIDFNKRLSSIAYTCLNGEPPEQEYLDNIYDDKTITVPATNVETYNIVQRLERCTVEVNKTDSANYINHDNNVTAEHNSIINPNMSMVDFFNNAGELYALGLQEEVNKEKKNKSKMYDNSDNYRRYLARQLERRDGTVPNTLFPTLSNSSSLLEDGTLQINMPDWLKVKDGKESEQKYAQSRQKFIESIYNPRR